VFYSRQGRTDRQTDRETDRDREGQITDAAKWQYKFWKTSLL